MGDPSFVWSLAESHCALCEREGFECACLPDWTTVEALVTARGLAEAQAAVIARFKDGWVPRSRADGSPSWRKDAYYPPLFEPMSEAEQLVLYPPVTEGDDSDG
mgnify:CR=1 FL=1